MPCSIVDLSWTGENLAHCIGLEFVLKEVSLADKVIA